MDHERDVRLRRWIAVFGAAGAVALAAGLVAAPSATWGQVLLLGIGGVQFGLAGALLVAIQFLTGSGWSVSLRRAPEAMTVIIPVAGLAVLAAQVFAPELYPWMAADYHAHGAFKHFWLSRGFFLARGAAYVLLWTWLSRSMVAASRRQDADRTEGPTRRLTVLSAAYAVIFGGTYTLAVFDWIMSREPDWVSTVLGAYHFAGLFSAGLAVMVIVSTWLAERGPFRAVYAERHRHDLGKLLFGMCCFWMYLWYSQYMLIWYVNFPEETVHYVVRGKGLLGPLFWLNVALNWAIPFAALMPASAKKSVKILYNVSAVVIAGRWLDLYLGLLPPTRDAVDGLVAVGLAAGALALYGGLIRGALGRAGWIPVGDPYLVESLPAAGGHPAREAAQA